MFQEALRHTRVAVSSLTKGQGKMIEANQGGSLTLTKKASTLRMEANQGGSLKPTKWAVP